MSNGWRLYWMMAAATAIIYLVMVLWSLPELSRMAGGQTAFDIRPFGYGLNEADAFLSALGEEGRKFYLGTQLVLDRLFPVLVAGSTVIALIALDRGGRGWGIIFSIFAIAGTVFDYLENNAVTAMLLASPGDLTADMVRSASSWTVLKSASHMIAFTGLLVLGLRAAFRRLRAPAGKAHGGEAEEPPAGKEGKENATHHSN